MRKKLDEMLLLGFLISSLQLLSNALSTPTATPTITVSTDIETCQCGVFLLGTQPLVFSADAKPILSGMPVPANCSAREDKLQCASICRQLIETMSQSGEDSPLVQTVVLAATRTLACQRFNESERVPAPRSMADSPSHHHAKLDGETNKWKFMVGPLPRLDVGEEEAADQEASENQISRLTQPKYLGGFYRWCDEHWIYAGVSLHEPLCCLSHLPKKCPPAKSTRNGRTPRLIIRRCKNDDCSSEEESDFQTLELTTPTASTTPTTATPKRPKTSEEDGGNAAGTSSETGEPQEDETESISPFDENKPSPPRKPLNSTAITEAFKFLTSLMDSIGYGDVIGGITSVLPASTAAELIDRVDVGGWVSNYQDRYMTWPREFSLGYCYLEYSLFNMANDGFSATANNLLSRLFKNQRSSSGMGAGGGVVGGAQGPLALPSNMNLLNMQLPPPSPHGGDLLFPSNYISPMAPTGVGEVGPPPHYHPALGNRRVKRGVTVSRSYSAVEDPRPATAPSSLRRIVRKKQGGTPPRERKVGTVESVPLPLLDTMESTTQRPAVPQRTTTTEQQTLAKDTPTINATYSSSSFVPSSSFIPTNPDASSYHYQGLPSDPQIPLKNPHYYQNQYYQYELPQQQQQQQQNYVQRSHENGGPDYSQIQNIAEFARPRRANVNAQESYQGQQTSSNYPPNANPYPSYHGYGHPLHPPISRQAGPPPPQIQKKEGGGGGGGGPSLMNIANMLVQTAMSANQGGSNGGSGDQVSNIMQNAIPLVSQVATNPAIQNMVSSLVTSFLTPPQKPSPPPPAERPTPRPTQSTPPSQYLDDEEDLGDESVEEPPRTKPGKAEATVLDSNEIDTSSGSGGSGGGGGGGQKPGPGNEGSGSGGMLPNLLSQMVSTYVKYLLGGPSNGGSSKPSGINNKNPVGSSGGSSSSSSSSSTKPSGEPKDIVDRICDVAKPFFMSYFGVVPDDPGFGKLRINRNGHRHRSDKDGLSPNDILTNDPDPGTGIGDVLFGSANIPETGNSLIDFGNRVVYAFHSANDAQHGLYCMKQYSVNKLWDYFRVGVRAVFKK